VLEKVFKMACSVMERDVVIKLSMACSVMFGLKKKITAMAPDCHTFSCAKAASCICDVKKLIICRCRQEIMQEIKIFCSQKIGNKDFETIHYTKLTD
jgi:hypothetical protein